ncbi:MAG: TatD family hydrolase [Candidatus Omnitrophica bacterium]|nr:TatD family hydrolase [Candidatus Omnitrophota bacterium]
MGFVDTHAHLHFPEFQSDFDQVMTRAQTAGVRFFVNVGTDLASSKQAIALAERFNFVYATVGIHPHDAQKATPEDMCELAGLAKHPKVVAIGEVGLDFYRNLSPEAVQRKVVIQFFEMAKQANLPLVLHIRDAYEAMIELLKEHFQPPVRAVSHCFAGTRAVMEELLKLGLYISFAGPVTYKKNDALREVVSACPENRILLETDAPFLAPQAHRGKRNESAFMAETAGRVAELKRLSVDQLSTVTSQNAEALFGRSFSV